MMVHCEVLGGVWATVDDNHRVTCQTEPENGYATFNFFGGPMELGITMSVSVINRCRVLLDEALVELAGPALQDAT